MKSATVERKETSNFTFVAYAPLKGSPATKFLGDDNLYKRVQSLYAFVCFIQH